MSTIRKVNPARAGMIPVEYTPGAPLRRKPRASGDDPCTPLYRCMYSG